jgi:BlaI family penicillinase repressor
MKLTEAEWQIMNALWQEWPATTRQIADKLPNDVNWAYTTIKTMLTRLTDKHVVTESKKGSVGVYTPVLSREDARRSALKSLANQAFDGSAKSLVMHLLEQDDPDSDELNEINKAISEYAKKKEEK